MSLTPKRLDRIDDKLSLFEEALKLSIPNRLVDIGFIPYDDRNKADLISGVVNIVSAGEGNYHSGRGMAAKEGTLAVNLICHLEVATDDTPRADLQQAEIDLAEDIKSFVRAGVPGMTVKLDSIQQSRLLEHPNGWVVAFIELHPPVSSTH